MNARPLPTSGGRQDDGGSGATAAPLVAHSASRLFPPMTDTEFTELCKDIAAHGLQDEIVLLDGQILEGNNRYRACLQTGVAPRFTVWEGDDPIAYVISKNLHRRHLTPAQKAAVAVEAEALYAEAAKARMEWASKTPTAHAQQGSDKGTAMAHAAAAVGSSERSAYDAKKIRAASPETFEEMKEGKVISIRAGLRKAGLHPGGNKGGGGKKPLKVTAPAKREVPEHVAAQARIRASDAETKYQSMLNAPEGKLNIPLLDRASKVQELLLELTGITPEKAATQMPAVRCREFSPEMAKWWLRFAELCEERRQAETPELPTLYKRARLPSLNPVVLGRPVAPVVMSPTMQAAYDWIKQQTEPVAVVEVAVATRMNRDTTSTVLRRLVQSGAVEVVGTITGGTPGAASNLYQIVSEDDGPATVS